MNDKKRNEWPKRNSTNVSQDQNDLNAQYENQIVIGDHIEDVTLPENHPNPENESGHEMLKCCKCYVDGMNKLWLRTIVILFWLGCTGVGILLAMPRFMDNTIFTIPIAPGTPSETATNAYVESFPEADATQPVLVVVQPPAGSSYTLLDNDHFKHFTQRLNNTVYAFPPLQTDPGFVRNVASYWSIMDMTPEAIRQQLHDVTSAIISSDNLTSFVLISLRGAASNAPLQPALAAFRKIGNFTTYLQDKDRMASINPDNLVVRVTGLPAFNVDTMSAVESDMMRVESVAAPLAMLVLGIMLRNFRLLILPLICMGTSLATALLLMWPISKVYPVVIIVPAILTCVVLALSVDYSLFLLSRFREEAQNGVKRLESVQRMMMFAGHTVLVSGITLMFCFCTTLWFPISMLISIGIGSVIAVFSTLVVNLTFIPAALLCCHGFFSHFQCLGCACCCCKNCRAPCDSVPLSYVDDESQPAFKLRDPVHSTASATFEEDYNAFTRMKQKLIKNGNGGDERTARGVWLDLGLCTQKFKYAITFLLLLGVAPFAYFSLQMDMVHSFNLLLPRTASSFSAYNTVLSNFGASNVFMSNLLVIPRDGNAVMSPTFFNRSHEYISFLKEELAGTEFEDTKFEGMMWSCEAGNALSKVNTIIPGMPQLADGCRIHFHTVDWALHNTWPSDLKLDIELVAYSLGLTGGTQMIQNMAWEAVGSMLNGTQQATSLAVLLPKEIDAMSPKGGKWIELMRSSIDKLKRQHGDVDDVFLCKGDIMFHDVVQMVFHMFPFVLAAILGVVFVLVGLFFCSFLVPLRSVLTVAMTLAWVYGFTILVYQYGILDFLHFDGLHSSGGCYWTAPLLCCPMIIGIALDYDIFLLTRILELRRTGLTDVGAIVSGLTRTGHIITAAGMIMAIAFAGLLMSNETTMNQISCLLVSAVLVDTFVVRSILVPAVMGMLGRSNWFPQHFCPCACLKLVPATTDPYDEAFLARTYPCCKCCHRKE